MRYFSLDVAKRSCIWAYMFRNQKNSVILKKEIGFRVRFQIAIGRVCHHILKKQYPFYPIRDIFCCLLRFSQSKITDCVTFQEDTAFTAT